MDPVRYQRLRSVLSEVSALSPEAARRRVDAALGDDAELHRAAVRLLASAVVHTGEFLRGWVEPPKEATLAVGTRVGGYRILGEIGRGGMGVVYEAEGEDGRRIALKVLHPHLLGAPQSIERFLKEARLGLGLSHGNVVRTLAAGSGTVDGLPVHFLAMERVSGRTLRALLDDFGIVPETLLREIARQVASGLAALHAAGIVHRDVKPENVFLTDERHVKISDLGVAKTAEPGPRLTMAGQFVGSLTYASPEQCQGGPVGPPADLYALGALLHELATGRPPFEGNDWVALVRAHTETVPERADAQNPSLSPFLAEVIATLLAKRPEDRFPSAEALRDTLEAGEAGGWWESHREQAAQRGKPRIDVARVARFVGREADLQRVQRAWQDAQRGQGGVVLVEGEAGVGKTRLVAESIDALPAGSATLLQARGGGGAAVAEALLDHFGRRDLEAALRPLLGAQAPMAGALAAWIRRDTSGSPLSAATLDALLVRLVQGLAERQPVVWVVEDVHLLDRDARRAVLALARGAEGRRALLLLTSRPPAPPDLVGELARHDSFRSLSLARLSRSQVVTLLEAVVRSRSLAERLTVRIEPFAGGVPWFVLECLREVERRGLVERQEPGPWRQVGRLEGVPLPTALSDLVRARLAVLSRDERAVLDAAAVLGAEFDPEFVARLRAAPRIRVLETLGLLERRDGLVRSGPTRCRFDHPLLQEVLYAEIPAALRAELHTLLSEAFLERAGPAAPRGEVAWEAVRHGLRGREPAAVLDHVLAAMGWLEATGRYEATCDLAKAALAVPDAGADRDRRRLGILIHWARRSGLIGRNEDAAAGLAEAEVLAARVGDPALSARMFSAAAYHAFNLSDYERVLGASAEADRLAGLAADDRVRLEANSTRGQALWCLGRFEEARGCHEEGVRLSRELGRPEFEATAWANLGVIHHERGLLEEAEAHTRRALELHRRLGDRRNESAVLSNLGNVLGDLGRRREALALYAEASALSAELALREGEAVVAANVGEVLLRLGDLEGSRRAYLSCEEVTREIGSRRVASYAVNGLGLVAAWEGDHAEARRRFGEALRMRREIGNRLGIGETLLALGTLDVEEGRTTEGRANLEEAESITRALGDLGTATLAQVHLALLPGGDIPAARALYERFEPRLRFDARLECLSLLYERTGDPVLREKALGLVEALRASIPAHLDASVLTRVPYLRRLLA